MWIPCLRIDWHLAWSGDQCWVRFHQLWTHKLNGRCRQGAMLGIWRKLAFTSPFLFVLWQTWCQKTNIFTLWFFGSANRSVRKLFEVFTSHTKNACPCRWESLNTVYHFCSQSTLYQALLRKCLLLTGFPKSLSFGTSTVSLYCKDSLLGINYLHSTNSTSVKIPGQCVSMCDDRGTLIDFFLGRHSSFKISHTNASEVVKALLFMGFILKGAGFMSHVSK